MNQMKEAMAAVIDATNTMSDEDMVDGMLEALNGSHRTLQQSFFGVFVKVMSDYGKNYDNGRFDLRNEASVKFAKEASKIEACFPFI